MNNRENGFLTLETTDTEYPSPITYQYFKGLDQRRIIFNDEVNEDLVEAVILPLKEMDQDGSGKPIELYITTNGGNIYSGMALCDVIDRLQTPTTIHILSHAFSMGALLAMAGKQNPNVKTVCYPHTVFLIHDGAYYFEGSVGQVKDTFAFQERYSEMIDLYILSHSKIPEDVYQKQKRSEWYMTAVEALAYGVVDEVL